MCACVSLSIKSNLLMWLMLRTCEFSHMFGPCYIQRPARELLHVKCINIDFDQKTTIYGRCFMQTRFHALHGAWFNQTLYSNLVWWASMHGRISKQGKLVHPPWHNWTLYGKVTSKFKHSKHSEGISIKLNKNSMWTHQAKVTTTFSRIKHNNLLQPH